MFVGNDVFKAQFSCTPISLPRDNCFIGDVIEFMVHVKLMSYNQVIHAFQLQGAPYVWQEISTELVRKEKPMMSKVLQFLYLILRLLCGRDLCSWGSSTPKPS